MPSTPSTPEPETSDSRTVAVELVRATKRYGALRAADAVSLNIYRGEFFTILGSSGSGKTTTLRLIGGFELSDDGKILINGRDITHIPAHKRDVHTVFQDYALFPHLNVFENVAFAPRLKGLRKEALREHVMHALHLVQLTGLEKRKPAQLSGGQQQRVALARAVVDRPAVLLLDEPLSALDAKIRTEVREELKLLQRETGITFVYVTHDQDEALTLSDRIAVMRGGKVLQVGTPIEVYEKPADLFVASFIGKANFLAGFLHGAEAERGQGTVNVDGNDVHGTLTNPIDAGSRVRIMVRPENLRVTPTASTSNSRVCTVTYLGHATEYLLDTPHGMMRSLELRRRGTVPMREGTSVELSWNWEEALIYADDGTKV